MNSARDGSDLNPEKKPEHEAGPESKLSASDQSPADKLLQADDLLPDNYDRAANNMAGFASLKGQEASYGLAKIEFELPMKNLIDKSLVDKSDNFSFGLPLSFRMKKSEFLKPGEDQAISALRPLINKFLESQQEIDTSILSAAELRQLEKVHLELANARSLQEAVNSMLYLIRLLHHLRYIDEARKTVGLLSTIDPDNPHLKELFKELERMQSPDIAVNIAPSVTGVAGLTKSALRRRILSLSQGTIMVVGDLLIDELVEGRPERISREAPVLILEHVDTELILGGAANTAGNIAALGGGCHAVGVCGEDEYAVRLAGLFDRSGITHALVPDPGRPTTVKTRILSSSHALRQQLLRIDRISHEPVSENIQRILAERVRQAAPNCRCIVLSDYRSGVIASPVVEACKKLAAESGLMVVVDAQDDFERFNNVTLITPNQPDTEKAVGFAINSRESLEAAGNMMLQKSGAQAVLITRGGEGMVLFQRERPMCELPTFNRSEVFDVTGAGDTVVATMSLALVAGASFVEAMALGNLAAGLVVKKPGTAVTNQKEMLEALETLRLPE